MSGLSFAPTPHRAPTPSHPPGDSRLTAAARESMVAGLWTHPIQAQASSPTAEQLIRGSVIISAT